MPDYDLLIVGAGPAGWSAAIIAAINGAHVAVLSLGDGAEERPGETLHPGIEPLLDQLGVGSDVRAGGYLRFPAVRVRSDGADRLEYFGGPPDTPWLGFQIPGRQLDSILMKRAIALGVTLYCRTRADDPVLDNGQVTGVRVGAKHHTASITLDCSGGRHWLARRLGFSIRRASPPLIAHFGYVRRDLSCHVDETIPCFQRDDQGWTWTAQILDEVAHWSRLNIPGPLPTRDWRPSGWESLRPVSRPRRANVTWRQCGRITGAGFLISGDAAMVLDPSSSQGVIRAMMSGIWAGQIAALHRHAPDRAAVEAERYAQWMDSCFRSTVDQLALFYARLPTPPDWVNAAS